VLSTLTEVQVCVAAAREEFGVDETAPFEPPACTTDGITMVTPMNFDKFYEWFCRSFPHIECIHQAAAGVTLSLSQILFWAVVSDGFRLAPGGEKWGRRCAIWGVSRDKRAGSTRRKQVYWGRSRPLPGSRNR